MTSLLWGCVDFLAAFGFVWTLYYRWDEQELLSYTQDCAFI